MNTIAEQVVNGLMHSGIRVAVNDAGDLSLRGRTRELTDDQRLDLQAHKAEIVRYLIEQPITQVVMYVASDLEHWTTDEPHIWADRVTIDGKEFARLTPAVIAHFCQCIARAEAACAAGKLSLDDFTRIVAAFGPVYEFAVNAGMVPNPVRRGSSEEEVRA